MLHTPRSEGWIFFPERLKRPTRTFFSSSFQFENGLKEATAIVVTSRHQFSVEWRAWHNILYCACIDAALKQAIVDNVEGIQKAFGDGRRSHLTRCWSFRLCR